MQPLLRQLENARDRLARARNDAEALGNLMTAMQQVHEALQRLGTKKPKLKSKTPPPAKSLAAARSLARAKKSAELIARRAQTALEKMSDLDGLNRELGRLRHESVAHTRKLVASLKAQARGKRAAKSR